MTGKTKTLPDPPPGFTPLSVSITKVWWTTDEPIKRKNPKMYTGVRRKGMKYESHVQEYLEEMYKDNYQQSPWIGYFLKGDSRPHWCQPDGILYDPSTQKLQIIEIKLSHTIKAWWQIRKLYQPLIEKLTNKDNWKIEVCEITRFYDSHIRYPERIELVDTIERDSDAFKVHILKP